MKAQQLLKRVTSDVIMGRVVRFGTILIVNEIMTVGNNPYINSISYFVKVW